MKIRTQFIFLIIGIVAVPVLCTLAILLIQYLSSPQRLVTKEFNRVAEELNLSRSDLDKLIRTLQKMPPYVETVVIAGHSSIIYSSMKDVSTRISEREFFEYIKTTSRRYSYQIIGAQPDNPSGDILVVSRLDRNKDTRPRTWQILRGALAMTALFVALCITALLFISRTIFKSITLLERHTQKIADGDLNVQIPAPPQHQSNEITSLTENLEKMRISLKESAERKDKFIMGISHDLRTPVALIKGYTEGIMEGVISGQEKTQKSLGLIHSKAAQLEAMINELINFVRLNTGEWRRQLEAQPLAPLLEEFAEGLAVAQDVFRRTVRTDIRVSKGLAVPMDTILVNRALENIYSNALRYTSEGDTICFSAVQEKEFVRINIADSGCGIKKDDHNRIFDLFYRGSNSRREDGFGIGLSVVKNITEAHGWNISVQSEEGKGTAFNITIPLRVNEPPAT